MISVSIPNTVEALLPVIQEIVRRAVDGSVVPLLVDSANGRIYIGASTPSASPAKLEINSGDIKVVTAGSGLILSNRSGTRFYRVVMEDDGAISADPL